MICKSTAKMQSGRFPAWHVLYAVLAILVLVFAGCIKSDNTARQSSSSETGQDRSVLYIAHVNDTHAHLDPVQSFFPIDKELLPMPVGGYPRLHTQVSAWRSKADKEDAGFLFLHAGDTFRGTGYFTLFQGEPEAVMWNRLGLDAMVAGNHEFDRLRSIDIRCDGLGNVISVSPGAYFSKDVKLAEFISTVNFPVLAANMLVGEDSVLSGIPNLAPYVVQEVDGHEIGIFGITLSDMHQISYPGQELVFMPEVQSAQKMVDLFKEKGISRIVMLSHIGYEQDMHIARTVEDIDIIVGGHSHTVLGDFSGLGITNAGPYPTWVQSSPGQKILVVQAGSNAAMAGLLRVVFNAQGQVVQASGANHLLALEDQDLFPPGETQLGQGAVMVVDAENPEDRDFIDKKYGTKVKKAYGPVIATIAEPLKHERVPTDEAGHGSKLAPLAAEAIVTELTQQGIEVDFAFVNAGGIRSSISAGEFRENQVLLDIMPFGNKIAPFELTGAQLKAVLETVISTALSNPEQDGRFPYPARLRYTFDAKLPEGQGLIHTAVLGKNDKWRLIEDTQTYQVATNHYIASGHDGYDLLKQFIEENNSLEVLSAVDSSLFTSYIKRRACLHDGQLSALEYEPVTVYQDTEY